MRQEWLDELNRQEFEHAGLKCLILRDKFLYLSGYAALPEGHPYFGKHFKDIPIRVHKGLTSSGQGDGDNREKGYWWVGFSCERPGDLVPARPRTEYTSGGEVYRNFEYVKDEVKKLAEQMAAA
ncbi:MAG: hypothetical protein ABID54_02870 [Pseudomonadota bacterium]